MFNKAENYVILFFVTKYLWMFKISDLSADLQSTEKSCTFPFKDTSLHSVFVNALEILSRQNWVGKLTFF